MTLDANQKLCWDIAEAEGWEYHDESKSTWPWLSPKREGVSYNARRECSCPHYLTDPELVRMLKALIQYYCDSVWFSLDAHDRLALHCQQWSIVQPECTNEVHVTDCDCLEIAVPQAYLAMLIERKEQLSAHNETVSKTAKSLGDYDAADNEPKIEHGQEDTT